MSDTSKPGNGKSRTTRPSLAAALIVKDEARCITRCLESVRPFVDRMVVVDTGSRDPTPTLAAHCGAQVHAMTWPDDFSIARNHALDLADADWSLVIDADEWIAGGAETLRNWCAGPPVPGAVCIESLFDVPDAGVPPSSGRNWIVRLLPRGVRYEGRVHEQPVSDRPGMRTQIRFGHDGYRDAQAAGKRARNLPLLERALEDNPGDPYLLYQLGTEAETRKDHGVAAQWYERALTRTAPDANWRHALVIRALHCLGQSGRAEAALVLATAEMEHWRHSPDFFFVLGNLLLDRAIGDPGRALGHWLPLAEQAWEHCLEIGERPDLEGSVQGRGSDLPRYNLEMMRGQRALLTG